MKYSDDDEYTTTTKWYTIINIVGATLSVASVALISCMFLGFLTLDCLDLQIKKRASIDADERRYATALLPIVSQHHRLLVTLLLMNAIAYEVLPLFLDNLIPSWAAIILSVTFLLIFGEVIPSAIFTGPDQLQLAARLVPLVKICIFGLYPIATPLVMLLDKLVPHDDSDDLYHRGELSALIRIQHEEREAKKARVRDRVCGTNNSRPHVHKLSNDTRSWRAFKKEIMEAVQEKQQRSRTGSFDSDITEQMTPPPLDNTEVKVVEGALTMKTKVALDVYTSIHHIFSVPCDLVLNKQRITEIYGAGYSRVPVYVPDLRHPERPFNRMLGFLMTRSLILIDWDDEREVSTLPLQVPPCIRPGMNLVELLKLLQSGGLLMAFVCAQPEIASKAMEAGGHIPSEAGFMGLVTLEDVLEAVLQETIIDEGDQTERALASAVLTHWAAKTIQRFLKKKRDAKQMKQKAAANGMKDAALPLSTGSSSSYTEKASLLEQQRGDNMNGVGNYKSCMRHH